MFSYLLNDIFTDRIMVEVKVENKNCLYMGLNFSERHFVIIFSHKHDMAYCVSSGKSWVNLRKSAVANLYLYLYSILLV